MRIIDLVSSVNFNICEGKIEVKFRSGRTVDLPLDLEKVESFDEALMSERFFYLLSEEADEVTTIEG